MNWTIIYINLVLNFDMVILINNRHQDKIKNTQFKKFNCKNQYKI